LNRHLHIVCLDVPWPPNYGGAIDMFYKMEALYRAGVKIHLHYFSYKHRGNPTELNRYCESIHIYKRKTGLKGFSLSRPYIVHSRMNPELLKNLQKDEHPVLFEGIHSTGILSKLDAGKRKIVVRLHNVECDYYRQLATYTHSFFKKIYYGLESRLLNRYEQSLPENCSYACITENDRKRFSEEFGLKTVFHLPAFIATKETECLQGRGNFCLYHGNLSVPENEKAASWLLANVFSEIEIPFVIAGKNPSSGLARAAKKNNHTCLVASCSPSEINDLIKKAHINVLPSFNTAGIKLKLLHALFEGRHCIANDAMVKGTGLEKACHIANDADAFISAIRLLYYQPFDESSCLLRKKLMTENFKNAKNIEWLIPYLW
jgi:glycosyltransferase involved in cell wall biosynthesis